VSYEFFIAKRYLWSKRRHPFVGVISTVSVLGIAVGVAALIVVLAVMNGFDKDLKQRIIGTRAHLVLEKEGAFTDTAPVTETLKRARRVVAVAPFVEGQALIKKDEWVSGVLVRGVDARLEKKVSKFYEYLTAGTLTERPDRAVVGAELAKRFGLRLGSKFQMLTQGNEKPLEYTVEGIFSSGLYDYDANLVFLNLQNSQALFGMQNAVSGLSVYLDDAERAAEVKREIQVALGLPYSVRTWMESNKTLFGALKLEKVVMFLILALIILVACLNIAGSLTLLVMDKTKDIGVLKALGATPGGLVRIFSLSGLMIGLAGALSGLTLGMAVCWALKNFAWFELPKEIYYLDRLPVEISGADSAVIFFVAVGLSLVSALYPALMAGKLDPVKALRYE